MPNKKGYQFPALTDEELNNPELLWFTGNPLLQSVDNPFPLDPESGIFKPGQLWSVTILQLKTLLTPEFNWKTITAGSCGITVNASTITYTQATGNANAFGAELNRQFVVPEDCKGRSLFVRTNGVQDASGDLIITIRKNGVDTALLITVPAGDAGPVYSNIVDEIDFVAGDLYSVQLNNQATAASTIIVSVGLTFIKQS